MSKVQGPTPDRHYEVPDSVWGALARWGMVLEQDKLLPSVATIIAGGPLNSSWWGHPAAKGTYEVLQALEEREEVVSVKLVSGRVTFVLQELWPALLGAALSHESWQLDGLSAEDRALLELVDDVGRVRLDELPGPAKTLRESARLLERRLLIHSGELHSESGAHTKVLGGWPVWIDEHWPGAKLMEPEAARAILSGALDAMNSYFGANARLPWQSGRSPR